MLLLAALALSACAWAPQGIATGPLVIQEQGSFAVGGSVITNAGTFNSLKPSPDGQTYHGDHAYVFYHVPLNARRLPLVLWHGAGQSSKTWETTPDGREGYLNIRLRRGFWVYLIDQPRRTVPLSVTPSPTSSNGSTSSGSACGPTSSLGSSSHTTRKRTISISGR